MMKKKCTFISLLLIILLHESASAMHNSKALVRQFSKVPKRMMWQGNRNGFGDETPGLHGAVAGILGGSFGMLLGAASGPGMVMLISVPVYFITETIDPTPSKKKPSEGPDPMPLVLYRSIQVGSAVGGTTGAAYFGGKAGVKGFAIFAGAVAANAAYHKYIK